MRQLIVGVALLTLTAACTGGTSFETSTTAAAPATSTSSSTSSTITPPPATTTTVPIQADWPADLAARHIENFLAALHAGEFEVAGWVMDNEGAAYADQRNDETAGEYLARVCGETMCAGEYLLSDPVWTGTDTTQGEWVFTVTHRETGVASEMTQGWHEGQVVVTGLPPLAPSTRSEGLVERLFEVDAPDHVVVSRYNAFEIWDRGSVTWIAHPWAGDEWYLDGGFVALQGRVVSITDPNETYSYECPRLLDRAGVMLVNDMCFTGDYGVTELLTGNAVEPLIDPKSGRDEVEFWNWLERGGAVIEYFSDAEGNLSDALTIDGVDLIGDDYPGINLLSTDGRWFAYVDHREGLSHFWSDVVVVRDVSDGDEVGRWALVDIVTCLEASGDWVLACLTPASTLFESPDVFHTSIAAIDLRTGHVTVVETRARVYLPVSP